MDREDRERVILAGAYLEGAGFRAQDGGITDYERSMEELKSLAEACLMEPVAVVTQKMESIHKGLYIGTGKAQEIRELAERLEADVVIFDNTLTPSQLTNLQKELTKPVMDRTHLILTIFESRAKTREAKLQVETAKLQYMLPRLVGLHAALTRQGGTSGSMSSRGVGETKLELDRRRIEHRLTELERELKEVAREREVQRKKRQSARIPLVALVGYTNAGKSTIMNAMVDTYIKEDDKKVLEKDMLFATLDTTVRRINTGNNRDFLLSDTVGFIHNLPHGLVKAFRSTLEEVKNADLLLQVVDYSDPYHAEQMETTRKTLLELEAGNIPMLTVYNKSDLCKEEIVYPRKAGEDKLYISAKEEDSLKLLISVILDQVYSDYVEAEFLIPYDKGNIVSYFREYAHIYSQKYEENGTRLAVRCHMADRDKYASYCMSKNDG